VSPSHEQGDLKEEQNEKIQSIVTVLKDKYNITNPIWFSAKEQTGLEELTDRISEIFFAGKISNNDQIYITNVRHRDLLKKALENLTLVENSIQNGMPEDFYSIDLMDAYTNLGLIIGEEVEDDLVNEIFHRFCMGK
jgi:tRNA modification GTPase